MCEIQLTRVIVQRNYQLTLTMMAMHIFQP